MQIMLQLPGLRSLFKELQLSEDVSRVPAPSPYHAASKRRTTQGQPGSECPGWSWRRWTLFPQHGDFIHRHNSDKEARSIRALPSTLRFRVSSDCDIGDMCSMAWSQKTQAAHHYMWYRGCIIHPDQWSSGTNPGSTKLSIYSGNRAYSPQAD